MSSGDRWLKETEQAREITGTVDQLFWELTEQVAYFESMTDYASDYELMREEYDITFDDYHRFFFSHTPYSVESFAINSHILSVNSRILYGILNNYDIEQGFEEYWERDREFDPEDYLDHLKRALEVGQNQQNAVFDIESVQHHTDEFVQEAVLDNREEVHEYIDEYGVGVLNKISEQMEMMPTEYMRRLDKDGLIQNDIGGTLSKRRIALYGTIAAGGALVLGADACAAPVGWPSIGGAVMTLGGLGLAIDRNGL